YDSFKKKNGHNSERKWKHDSNRESCEKHGRELCCEQKVHKQKSDKNRENNDSRACDNGKDNQNYSLDKSSDHSSDNEIARQIRERRSRMAKKKKKQEKLLLMAQRPRHQSISYLLQLRQNRPQTPTSSDNDNKYDASGTENKDKERKSGKRGLRKKLSCHEDVICCNTELWSHHFNIQSVGVAPKLIGIPADLLCVIMSFLHTFEIFRLCRVHPTLNFLHNGTIAADDPLWIDLVERDFSLAKDRMLPILDLSEYSDEILDYCLQFNPKWSSLNCENQTWVKFLLAQYQPEANYRQVYRVLSFHRHHPMLKKFCDRDGLHTLGREYYCRFAIHLTHLNLPYVFCLPNGINCVIFLHPDIKLYQPWQKASKYLHHPVSDEWLDQFGHSCYFSPDLPNICYDLHEPIPPLIRQIATVHLDDGFDVSIDEPFWSSYRGRQYWPQDNLYYTPYQDIARSRRIKLQSSELRHFQKKEIETALRRVRSLIFTLRSFQPNTVQQSINQG
ncbi:hypothetical protein RFI_09470, partial [Reticulomyxa filosa]